MSDSARVKEIFIEALDRPEDQRAAYVERVCGDDVSLRREVKDLLAANAGPPILETAAPPNASTTASATPLTGGPGTRIGPYKLLQLVGEGGFGQVWLAEQKEPVRRRVALKIIKLGMDTREVLARFEAERQALAMMDHPNIAKVFDAGAHRLETGATLPYFVMEHVAGLPITDFCDTAKMRIRQRLDLFLPVCNAVQHAHMKGVIHRDIKPSNILVTLVDGKPVPKVIDFGIAKATSGHLTDRTLFTEMGRLIGTPEYMSPEQAGTSGLDVDTRTDVYSLGVILYQLLTGTLPFDPKSLRSAGFDGMAKIIREMEPPKPSTRLLTIETEAVNRGEGQSPEEIARRFDAAFGELRKSLRGDLDWIVMKCLEKDRGRRYETAIGLAADVQRHLSGEPVVAAPPSAAYRVRKFVRKHRGPVIAASVIAATLVLATFVSMLALGAAEKASRRSQEQTQVAEQANSRLRILNEIATGAVQRLGSELSDERGCSDAYMTGAFAGWLERRKDEGISSSEPKELLNLRFLTDMSVGNAKELKKQRDVAEAANKEKTEIIKRAKAGLKKLAKESALDPDKNATLFSGDPREILNNFSEVAKMFGDLNDGESFRIHFRPVPPDPLEALIEQGLLGIRESKKLQESLKKERDAVEAANERLREEVKLARLAEASATVGRISLLFSGMVTPLSYEVVTREMEESLAAALRTRIEYIGPEDVLTLEAAYWAGAASWNPSERIAIWKNALDAYCETGGPPCCESLNVETHLARELGSVSKQQSEISADRCQL